VTTPNSILVLGASGYIGQEFVRQLEKRGLPYSSLSRAHLDYSRFDLLVGYLRKNRPAFLINAAGYTGKPNVDACEIARADTLAGNTLLPQTIAQACESESVPWGHVSSGCIYSGAKFLDGGVERIQPDLSRPDLKNLAENQPNSIHGFSEEDEPNFTFRRPPCSFYSGTKALAEEAVAGLGRSYIWRLRIPFDEFDNSRNFLSKLQRYPKVYDNVNSISHRADYVRACLDLWERRAPFGIYNLTNPGFITSRHVVSLIERILKPARKFEFWKDDEEFYRVGVKTPRSNCVLDITKALAAGITIRPVEAALEDALNRWTPEQARSTQQ
jgi:dTDP-4-dehydrorhamnose reductase